MCGAEALDKFRPDRYDLVFLDIQLPDMTGFDIADELYRRYPDQLPPLVALTANLVNDPQQYQQHGMQAVIGKPLALGNLRKTLNELFVGCALPVAPVVDTPDKHVLDIAFLQDFTGVVGCDVMESAINLFEQSMPEYMTILNSALTARDKPGVVEEAHKIKSAAGAIGLKRIYQLAQQAQSPDLPAWQENINDWVESIGAEYQGDLERLRQWLEQQRASSDKTQS